MPFNGSGVFQRVYNWTNDANNNIKIRADRMDTETDGIATGLSTCLTKDGQTTITANLPMAGFKHTGVGNSNARNQYAATGQIQDQSFVWCSTSGGTANAQTLSPAPVITAYTAGQKFSFLPVATNTSGTVTIANSGLATRNVKKGMGGAKVILAVGDLIIAVPAEVIDDGTDYILLNPQTYSHGADIASATTTVLDTATGDLVDVTGTTTITAITLSEGRECTVRFTGILTLTHGASLVLPGGVSITTAAGDYAVFRGYASSVVRCVNYIRASGLPIVNPTVTTPVYFSAIAGFLPSSIAGNSTTASLSISAGQATDSTNASIFAGGTFSWAASNGNAANGYQGGTTLPNSSTIHFYAMATNADTTWSTSFASTSLTPTLPGSYTKYRRLFSLQTTGAGAPIPYATIEINGGGTIHYLTTQVLDVNTSITTTASLQTLSVPTGIKVAPLGRATITSVNLLITSPDETDVLPTSTSGVPLSEFNSSGSFGMVPRTTNTSGQLRFRATGTGTAQFTTSGWVDFRR